MPFYRCSMPSSSGGGGGSSSACEHISVIDNNGGVVHELPLKFNRSFLYITNAYGNYYTFNSPITIGSKVITANELCRSCYNFNSPVNMQNATSLSSLTNTFYQCYNFNLPVDMHNATNLSNLYNTFYQCYNFNSPVIFPRSGNLCAYFGVFRVASKYNQPTKFYFSTTSPSVVASASFLFVQCNEFNSRVDFEILSENIRSIKYDDSFKFAPNFNQPLLLKKASSINNLVCNSVNMTCPLLIDAASGFYGYNVLNNSNVNTVIILNFGANPGNISWYASCPITYYVDDITNFATRSQWLNKSIRNNISFTQITNGLYNSTYNIYIYNNVNDGCNYFNNFWYNCYGEYPVY